MPRPRSSQQSTTTLSPGQATYVLERLVAERRISPAEIYRYLSDINREISSLEQRLSSLRGAAGGGGSYSAGGGTAATPRRRGRGRGPGRPRGSGAQAAASAAPPAAAPTGRRRGRPPGRKGRPGRPPGRPPGSGAKKRGGAALTPEQLASRQLQGRYLGLIRQIPASKRGQYQKTAKEKGREAAIKEMQETLKK